MAHITIYANKGFTLENDSPVQLYDNGAGFRCLAPGNLSSRKGSRLDGSVSSASFRRLREFLLVHDCLGNVYGVTLTIPGISILRHWYVKNLWQNVSNWCSKHGIPLVWRVELQQRGQAHFHCVVFGSVVDVLRLFEEWYRVLSVRMPEVVDDDLCWIPAAYVRGANYACMFERLDGSHRAFRYLVNHQSKGKVAQLGFEGRQWGVVCRRKFTLTSGYDFDFTWDEYVRFLRLLRRLTRSRVNTRRGCRAWICDPVTVKKMVHFVRDVV